MNLPDTVCKRALSTYPEGSQLTEVESLGCAGGFSGARLWRIRTARDSLCLRRWPLESPTVEELQFIHAVLEHVFQSGYRLVPRALRNKSQQTFTQQGGYLWELTPWLPGRADDRKAPSETRFRAAMVALAEFHLAAAIYPLDAPRVASSSSIMRRRQQLHCWLQGDLERLAEAVRPEAWPELDGLARTILAVVPDVALSVLGVLEHVMELRVPLQPCVGDIWYDHVLFEGATVTGLIDFGAMRVDNVACDVARLLGSVAEEQSELWRVGLEAYQSVRPLSDSELQLVTAFDRGHVVMSGLNWVDWIYRQGRVFENHSAIPHRLAEIVRRLETLASSRGIVTAGRIRASSSL